MFIVATANDVSALPQALYRPGRIDASFWVGLPEESQRIQIIKIHLKKSERAPTIFTDDQYKQLAVASLGFSGACIQTWVQASINNALDVGHDDVTIQDFLDTVKEIPITSTNTKEVKDSIKWANENHARQASDTTKKIGEPEVAGDRKILNLSNAQLSVKPVPKAKGDNQ